MSPEQARGGAIDARSDLWSLGVMIYQAVTGERPFSGDHPGDVLVRICSEAPPPATQFAPDLPAEIDAFFERALCRSPDGRFQSARAMADALAAIAARHPHEVRTGVALAAATRRASNPVEARGDETASLEVALDTSSNQVKAIPRSNGPGAGEAAVSAGAIAATLVPDARRRPWRWVVGAAVIAGAAWVAWQSPLLRHRVGGADDSAPPAPLAESAPEPARAAATTAPEVAAAPAASAADANAAPPNDLPVASAAPSVKAAPRPAPAPRAAPQRKPRGPTPPPGSPSPRVDPKFGLPVQTP
jgi:serine/threonine-protein kinase